MCYKYSRYKYNVHIGTYVYTILFLLTLLFYELAYPEMVNTEVTIVQVVFRAQVVVQLSEGFELGGRVLTLRTCMPEQPECS